MRQSLGSSEFEQAKNEGLRLTVDGAVEYANRGRGQRRRPSIGWDSLTPAELQVVGLVAKGLSNNDIAEQLFVGRRTVQTHLTHVFAKLGLRGRAELAAEAARRQP